MSRTLSIVILLAILGAAAALYYAVTYPEPTEEFTEFYILNVEGRAVDYPEQLSMGEETPLILGIINREQKAVSYRVEIKIGGVTDIILEPIALEHNGRFEQVVNILPESPGMKQKIEFLLYKQGETEVYESLYLWVDVEG